MANDQLQANAETLLALADENEMLLDQFLEAQILIENLKDDLENIDKKYELLVNLLIENVIPYVADNIRRDKERALGSEIEKEVGKFSGPPPKRNFWKMLAKDAGKKFVRENGEVRNALEKGASADEFSEIVRKAALSPDQTANALTEIAKSLDAREKADLIADLAFRAWATHPLPFRLKWLAFRCHKSGDNERALCFLNMLPEDMPMTESERNTVRKIQQKVSKAYGENARKLLLEKTHILNAEANDMAVQEKKTAQVPAFLENGEDQIGSVAKAYRNALETFKKIIATQAGNLQN